MARGSLSELETQLLIAKELDYTTDSPELDALIEELFRVMSGLIGSLKAKAD
jgi:four helix bundle protein